MDVAKLWGDLPDSHRHLRIHIPLCCCYTKISIDWRGRLDSNQGHPASEASVLPLNYAPTGCPGRLRTRSPRLNRALLFRLSYWTSDWYRSVDSNHAPPAYRAGALSG